MVNFFIIFLKDLKREGGMVKIGKYNSRTVSLKVEFILDMDEKEERYLYGPPVFLRAI
jgi:hypothetical protein